MIYFLNNIKFGHPKISKFQLLWFDSYFIPLITKKGGEKIIINGDLFYNNKHITFELLSKVRNILSSVTIPIYIIGNEYCYDILKDLINNTQKNDYAELENSLFQFSKEDNSNVGFYIITDKTLFIPNKQTPKFVEYKIEKINDLENIIISKDFITIDVNGELLENQQFKNKIDLFLNNNPSISVYYSNSKEKNEEKIVKIDNKNMSIRNILIDNIDEDLKTELNEIFDIYDSKVKL